MINTANKLTTQKYWSAFIDAKAWRNSISSLQVSVFYQVFSCDALTILTKRIFIVHKLWEWSSQEINIYLIKRQQS